MTLKFVACAKTGSRLTTPYVQATMGPLIVWGDKREDAKKFDSPKQAREILGAMPDIDPNDFYYTPLTVPSEEDAMARHWKKRYPAAKPESRLRKWLVARFPIFAFFVVR